MKIAGWLMLLVIGILLIILGARGRLGSAVGALITPADLDVVK